ncbi:MAG: four helix bundle protein [Candidatus Omnitrophica bacterium]|nr:four helix bundle protein [Candidatus Omnitrophota bacterium]
MQNKKYDLEDRTLLFAKACIDLCKIFIRNTINIELISQLIRSSSSVGANYREANDSTTKKDFYHRIGICRREAKESKYWLELLLHSNKNISNSIEPLIDEALQLARIFASIVKNNH